MKKKKSLKDRRKSRLTSLSETAAERIRNAQITEFTRAWLASTLGVDEKEASQVASQLKKDLVLHGVNDLSHEDGVARYRVRT